MEIRYLISEDCSETHTPLTLTGETFTAYLGALNVSNTLDVKALTVTAQLQTPSARLPLPSTLDA
jgi:hypothetical protein